MALDVAGFQKTLIYEVEQPAHDIFPDIASLRALDKRFEKIERRWRNIAILFGVAAAAVAGVAFFHFEFGLERGPLFAGVAGGLLVCTIAAVILKKRKGSLNTQDRRYELVGQLLRLLGADMASEASVSVRLDLGAPDARTKFDRKGKVRQWKVKYYVDPWLRLQGRLIDGTRFVCSMVEKVQHRSCWKRSRSGKSKRKTKTKYGAEVAVLLRVKADRYRHLARLQSDAASALQLPPLLELKDFQVSQQGLSLKARLDPEWTVSPPEGTDAADGGDDGSHAIAMMFLSLYQVLNLSKTIDKRAGANA